MNPILAINYNFPKEDLQNRIFSSSSHSLIAPYMVELRDFMSRRGVEVVTVDVVDFRDPAVKAVLYFDYHWKVARTDTFLSRIPFEKRALVLLEPAIVNPSMYYTRHWRRRFKTVFTWDERLLRRNPGYERIRVPVGADLAKYRDNPFLDKTFEAKKFLVAVSSNRWSYWPQATFPLRRKVYRFMYAKLGDGFDLFGHDWDRPCSRLEKLLGRSYPAWRGEIPGSWDSKVARISDYKFMICLENSVGQPGYISEKIFDCFCARTVPVYLGSKGSEKILPSGAYIDFRDFGSLAELTNFLKHMSAEQYAGYVRRIDDFMHSDRAASFSNEALRSTIFRRLFSAGV